MMIRPLHDRILAKPVVEEHKSSGGLFVPDPAKEMPTTAVIAAPTVATRA